MDLKLTGIKPTGQMHLGNEIGMNIAEIDASVLVMIADAHSMTRTNHITGAVSSVREDSYILTAELLVLGCEECAILSNGLKINRDQAYGTDASWE